jgi:hypothetical protein
MAVERPVLDQLQIEVGRTPEDRALLPCERNGTSDSSLSRATTSTASPLTTVAFVVVGSVPVEAGKTSKVLVAVIPSEKGHATCRRSEERHALRRPTGVRGGRRGRRVPIGYCEGRGEAGLDDGETRTRTGTPRFSAAASSTGECGQFAAKSRACPRSPCSRGFPHFHCDCGRVRHTIANLCLIDSRHAAACPRACSCRAIGPTRRPRLSNLANAGVGNHAMARRCRARLSRPLAGCVKPGAGPCRSPQAWPLSGRRQPTAGRR